MQRRAEPHDSLDDFPTPPWATRALLECLDLHFQAWVHGWTTCREPTANRGHMVGPLRDVFASVEASDIFDYGVGFPQADYLFGPDPEPVDWTITNPPFRLAEEFILRAIRTSVEGVAVIVRSAFLEGVGRYSRLFKVHPPRLVLQFSERVVMHKGRLSPNGSTATAYSWLIWTPGQSQEAGTTFGWIPPCRKRLERSEDYVLPEGSL